MKVPRNWMDEPNLFDAVAEVLDGCGFYRGEASVCVAMELDGYGGRGYIHIRTGDGRQFALDLYELT